MASLLALMAVLTVATAQQGNLREGDVCGKGPSLSYCRYLKDCEVINRSENQPEVCSYDGEQPIVCCNIERKEKQTSTKAPMPDKPVESVADKMCREYSKYIYRMEKPLIPLPNEPQRNVSYCGMVATPLIVGGEEAKRREFPHMARIGFEFEKNIYWHCAGSLISENFILSAAHCSRFQFNDQGYMAEWVQLGVFDTVNDDDGVVTIKILEIIDHPQYKEEFNYHDISLYKLEKSAPLGIDIRPICLNTDKNIPSGLKVLATGWGLMKPGDDTSVSTILQKVGLPIIPNHVCKKSYKQIMEDNAKAKQRIQEGIVESMICAEAPGKDSCTGDSGGPLQKPIRDPHCMYSQIGIISFGVNCSMGFPGVYTNVASYLPWIESTVWPT